MAGPLQAMPSEGTQGKIGDGRYASHRQGAVSKELVEHPEQGGVDRQRLERGQHQDPSWALHSGEERLDVQQALGHATQDGQRGREQRPPERHTDEHAYNILRLQAHGGRADSHALHGLLLHVGGEVVELGETCSRRPLRQRRHSRRQGPRVRIGPSAVQAGPDLIVQRRHFGSSVGSGSGQGKLHTVAEAALQPTARCW
mmetsp:Transcript_96785/g.312551  ORF Transcript_96785/g.312551 Transcript_96785/m.312551 type:complete len:200 (+) Transcript_96785:982-1581(+)